jgi:hypothetical protein
VEGGDHLLQCIVYTDLNMLRAGVVAHPFAWPFSGYTERSKSPGGSSHVLLVRGYEN